MKEARGEQLLAWILGACAGASALLVLSILAFLAAESLPALAHVGSSFWSDDSWHPAPVAAQGTFGLAPMLIGTCAAAAGALLVAVPLGVLSAVCLRFYAPRAVARLLRRVLELLAGIPSVVYGFWGLVVLVPLVRRLAPPGPSLLAGILVLATMVLPTVALSADSALAAVPARVLHGASALGLSRATLVRGVALPAARAGIASGVILAAGRALGETMAILMVCGNIVQVPTSLFDPVRTLTAGIALEMAYAGGDHRSALFVCGLVLFLLVGALVAAADLPRAWPGRARG